MKNQGRIATLALVAAAATSMPLHAATEGMPESTADCGSALLVSVDHTNLDNPGGGSGSSGLVEWIRCHSSRWSSSLGASSHAVAGTHWRLARGGLVLRQSAATFYAQVHAGRGTSATHRFDYAHASEGALVQWTPALQLRGEHQAFSIDRLRGHLFRVGLIARMSSVAGVEMGYARSVGGTVELSSRTLRIDIDAGRWRPFLGLARGRQVPTAFDAATGDVSSRQSFAGVVIPLRAADLIAAMDDQRGASHRRTWTLAVRWNWP